MHVVVGLVDVVQELGLNLIVFGLSGEFVDLGLQLLGFFLWVYNQYVRIGRKWSLSIFF